MYKSLTIPIPSSPNGIVRVNHLASEVLFVFCHDFILKRRLKG